MNRRVKRLIVGLSVVLMAGGVWWARALASWRPQLIGVWPQSVPTVDRQAPIQDAGFGIWFRLTENAVHQVESGRDLALHLPEGLDWESLHFAPDGQTFGLIPQDEVYGSTPFRVEWRDLKTGRLRRRFTKFIGHYEGEVRPHDLCFSPDGKQLYLLSYDGVEMLPLDGSKGAFVKTNTDLYNLSSDGKWLHILIDSDSDKAPKLYDMKQRRFISSFQVGRPYAEQSLFSPDSRLLAVCDNNDAGSSGCWVADVKANRKLWTFKGKVFKFAPDDRMLLFDYKSDVELREAPTGRLLRQWKLPFAANDFFFSRDGDSFYAATDKGQIWKIRVR